MPNDTDYKRIASEIAPDASLVGIDAKKPHVMIVVKLESIEPSINRFDRCRRFPEGSSTTSEGVAEESPRINQLAASFETETTYRARSLDDYKDRWLVLLSHPSDFTPVCPTEFSAFARANNQSAEIGCDLLGLSIDSVFSYIAWAKSIEDNFGVEIPFPTITDLSMSVASVYGMIQPGASNTEAVRAVFIIDPKGVLRTMLYYPMSAERSIAEILRLVQAMQLGDEHGVVTPERWKPGDAVITNPPRTLEEARARKTGSDGCKTWTFSISPALADAAEVSR